MQVKVKIKVICVTAVGQGLFPIVTDPNVWR